MYLHSSFGHSTDTSVLHMNHLSPGLPRAFFGRCNVTLANEIQHRATHLLTGPHHIAQSGFKLTILPPPLFNQENRHVST